MREPRTIEGGLPPLFDRLSGKQQPSRKLVLDRRGLRISVMEELNRLLQTRASQEAGTAVSILDYGLPDFALYTAGEAGQREIADAVARRIAAFEPRLSDVRVTLDRASLGGGAVRIHVSAALRTGTIYEPVSFPLAMDRGSRRIGIEAAATADTITEQR